MGRSIPFASKKMKTLGAIIGDESSQLVTLILLVQRHKIPLFISSGSFKGTGNQCLKWDSVRHTVSTYCVLSVEGTVIKVKAISAEH